MIAGSASWPSFSKLFFLSGLFSGVFRGCCLLLSASLLTGPVCLFSASSCFHSRLPASLLAPRWGSLLWSERSDEPKTAPSTGSSRL